MVGCGGVRFSSRRRRGEGGGQSAVVVDRGVGRRRGSLIITAAASPSSAKGGGLIVHDVNYTPVGAGVTVLERVNLTLQPTGLNLIVGRSGFGKSTLLSLVAGLAEPTAGVITFSDLDPTGNTHLPSASRLDRVGLVFQFPERHFLGREETGGWRYHQHFRAPVTRPPPVENLPTPPLPSSPCLPRPSPLNFGVYSTVHVEPRKQA